MRSVNRVTVKIGLLLALLWASSVSLAEAGINVRTTNGPGGGGVLSLAIDPFTPTTLYAGTDGNGVFKSTERRSCAEPGWWRGDACVIGRWGRADLTGFVTVRN